MLSGRNDGVKYQYKAGLCFSVILYREEGFISLSKLLDMETYIMHVNGKRVIPIQKKTGIVISSLNGVVTFSDGSYCFTQNNKDIPYWVKQ